MGYYLGPSNGQDVVIAALSGFIAWILTAVLRALFNH
jgi:hypothetical protein